MRLTTKNLYLFKKYSFSISLFDLENSLFIKINGYAKYYHAIGYLLCLQSRQVKILNRQF